MVLQYTGFQATGEVRTFRLWNRARNLTEFRAGLDQFDVGGQNWAYADADGNLGYFTSAEVPLRADLEAGAVVGLPPFFVRDGESGANNWIPDPAHSQGQAIPFAILPYDEMPQTLNPPNHFFANANNDPAGTSLDNDMLNQRRLSNPNAIYYLSGGYDEGLRSGRITQLVRDQIQRGPPISITDMRRFQTNTQERDAELMTPFSFRRWRTRRRPVRRRSSPRSRPIRASSKRSAASRPGTSRRRPASRKAGTPAINRRAQRGGAARGDHRERRGDDLQRLARQADQDVIDTRLASLGVGRGSARATR